MKIILPSQPRRIELMSFWLVLSISFALIISIVLWLISFPLWPGVGLILLLGPTLLGILRPASVPLPYRFWNRIARYFARRASLLIMGICYFVIFVAVGLAGARIVMACPIPIKSIWVPRRKLASAEYASQFDSETKELPAENWISAFLSWAKRSGNLWACCLLPFLVLLSYLETGEEGSVSGSIYTLY